MNRRYTEKDDVINQMTRVILTDILEHVVEEFEHTTGTRIGSIQLSAEEPLTDKRRTIIEILHADSESLMGLLKYKQILCEHEPFTGDDLCRTEQNSDVE